MGILEKFLVIFEGAPTVKGRKMKAVEPLCVLTSSAHNFFFMTICSMPYQIFKLIVLTLSESYIMKIFKQIKIAHSLFV